MNKKSMIATALAMVLGVSLLTGCGTKAKTLESGSKLAASGVLLLKVNPEIAVEYDETGTVVDVTALNEDAKPIVEGCEDLTGKQTRSVVTALVTEIGEAGYFVEEVEGGNRQITIEIEAGSKVPYETFLEEVVADVEECVNTNAWDVPVEVDEESETDYEGTDYDEQDKTDAQQKDGTSDYDDTDYGVGNDGVTDYKKPSDKGNGTTAIQQLVGDTDYDDTDYGVGSDGVTDYDDTDYDDTDYGVGNDGVTDYDDTDYEETSETVKPQKPQLEDDDTDYDADTDDDDDADDEDDDDDADDEDDDSDEDEDDDEDSDYGDSDYED